MANVKIRELSTGAISNNSDYFVIATNEGSTVKVPYSALATFLFGTSLAAGSNISITDATEQDGIKRYSISATEGRDGKDGITPHINSADKHWYIGETDTNIIAEGQNGTNGTNGVTPHIDAITKHWFIGETDTNVIAEGQNGAQGQQGIAGDSIYVTTESITGGNRIIIHHTDTTRSDQTIDVMDGTEIIQTTSDDRTVTLSASNWQGDTAPYTQTVSILGVTSDIVPIIAPSYSDTIGTALEQRFEWSKITKATSDTNSLTFKCYEDKPTVDLTVIIKVV